MVWVICQSCRFVAVPAGPVTRTWKLFHDPAAALTVRGVVQAVNAASFREHWVAVTSPPLDQANVALVVLVGDGGVCVSVTDGGAGGGGELHGVVGAVTVAPPDRLPAASTALTTKL